MKIFLLSVCLLGVIIQSMAQHQDDKAFYQNRIQKFQRIKKLGVGLTAVGGVALIAGLVIDANNRDNSTSIHPTQEEDRLTVGEVTAIGSLFLIGPGIPLCIVGSKGESKYKAKLRAVSVLPNITSLQVGVTLAYNF
jgi:hypothetical protein